MKGDVAGQSAVDDAVNHYVLVIHGTWNAPVKGSIAWYQLDEGDPDNFCAKLSAILAGGPLANSLWRKIPGTAGLEANRFSWSGDNSHAARIQGAEDLANHIQSLISRDPRARLHFIAHSHGGNVLLKAIQIHLDKLEQKTVASFFGEKFAATSLSQEFSGLHNFFATRPARVLSRINRHFELAKSRPTVGQQAAIENFRATARARPAGFKKLVLFWLTRPITVVHARRKAAWQFIRDWITLPDQNNIGRLVFLGTPFLYKLWRPGFLDKFQSAKRAVDIWGGVTIAGLVAFLAGFFVGSVWLGLAGAGVVGIAMATYMAAIGRLRMYRDVNVYFSPTYSFRESLIRVKEMESNPFYEGSLKSQFEVWRSLPRVQMETLVLSGGHLDEALLALSVEPLLRAIVAPEVEKLITPELWPVKPALKVGMSSDQEMMKKLMRMGAARQYAAAVLFYPVNWVRRYILKKPTRSYLMSKLLIIANSIGTGVAANEFERAEIVVRKDLVDEQGFFRVVQMDLERELASRPLLRETKSSLGNFEYLWNEQALDERLAYSYLWPKIEAQLPALQDVYRGTALAALVMDTRRLQRMCVTLDERIRALAGAVEVLHSAYYSHDKVVKDIARFLEHGRVGADRAA
jgi:hypothetical protein